MASDAARPRANPRGFSPLTQKKRRSAKPLCRFWRKVRDYLRRHENKMAMTGRRLDGFGRCASSREPAGVLTLTQQKRRSAKPLCRFWRKVRDSNPRMLAHQRFSRPPRSTAPPTFRIEIAEKSRQFFVFAAIARCRRQRTSASEVPLRQPSVLKLPRKIGNFFYFCSRRDRSMP